MSGVYGVLQIYVIVVTNEGDIMISVDDKDIKKLERDLKTFADRAYPFATKNTLNNAAFTSQKMARRDVTIKMIERNKFTGQSIQVDQARTLNVRRQAATVGSVADYMEDQEFGAVKSKRGAEGVAIPTTYSSGEAMTANIRRRLPRKANTLRNIQLQRKGKRGRTRQQQNLIAIQEAASSTRKYVFLDLGKRKGIFKVIGGRRKPKIRMVHDLTEQVVTIPRNPWLKPVIDTVSLKIPEIHAKSLRFQLKRLGLFDGV